MKVSSTTTAVPPAPAPSAPLAHDDAGPVHTSQTPASPEAEAKPRACVPNGRRAGLLASWATATAHAALKSAAFLAPGIIRRLAGAEPYQFGGLELDPNLQLLASVARKGPSIDTQTPEQAREGLVRITRLLHPPPIPMASVDDRLIPGGAGPIGARVYRPKELPERPCVFVYYHGGGCVTGAPLDLYDPLCTRIAAQARCIVLSVDYRLAPEHPFPAAPDDAVAAFRWAQENAGELGSDQKRIAVGGDSAGGMLAALVCQAQQRDQLQQPCFQLLFYPWTLAGTQTDSLEVFSNALPNTRKHIEFYCRHYFKGPANLSDWRTAPARNAIEPGLAPAHIAIAGIDVLKDDSLSYVRRLNETGTQVTSTTYDSLCHGFVHFNGISSAAAAATQATIDVLKDALSAQDPNSPG